MSLASLSLFKVSTEIVHETEQSLRLAGREGMECFVLWSGVVSDNQFLVRTAHVPKQTAFQFDSGLMVRIDGDALHQLNVWLYENDEILAVQVHAHPTKAFHSKTDDTYPIVTIEGGISIVAANFCRSALFSPSTAVFRLERKNWQGPNSSLGLFQVS